MAPIVNTALDIVTVAFPEELGLLRLQARSLHKYFDLHGVGKIMVIANDRHPDEFIRKLEGLRHEYGSFSDLVEFISPIDLLNETDSWLNKTERLWVSRYRGKFKSHSGWGGNQGWRMQQAFKLLSVNASISENILILDAKNHFICKAGISDFLAEDRIPKTYLQEPSGMFEIWARHSFRFLDPDHEHLPARIPRSVTPFVVGTHLIKCLVRDLEAKVGPLECYFARRNKRTTEFMLLFAYAELKCGGWLNVTREGLPRSKAIFRTTAEDLAVQQVIEARSISRGELADDQSPIFSIHRARLNNAPAELREAVVDLWEQSLLISSRAEGLSLFS